MINYKFYYSIFTPLQFFSYKFYHLFFLLLHILPTSKEVKNKTKRSCFVDKIIIKYTKVKNLKDKIYEILKVE